jgi:hypothetical protein
MREGIDGWFLHRHSENLRISDAKSMLIKLAPTPSRLLL